MPAITDKFNQATTTGRPSPAALTAVKTIGATSITVDSTAEWPTDTAVHFIIYEVDANNDRVAGTQCDFKGIVNSATTINNLTLKAGTDREYPIGSKVIAAPTAAWADDVVEGIAVEHNQDGTHSNITATTVTADEFIVSGTAGANNGWTVGLPTPNTVTNNGNRSYDLVFNATDLTDTVSEGMRLRTTRTVSAPTQCADLEASSSQYFNDTTVAGMTFTDDFVASAWVKLESYTDGTIVSRYNGVSGWRMFINSSGNVRLDGFNGSGANISTVQSYQSIPLNKWVHVAAQLDMSAFTATTTTSYIMIDGVNVPATVSRGGTNPTALVQAGNIEVGSSNGGTVLFDGKLAQVAVFSAKVTQDTMRTYMSQGLSGSETNLVSAYSLSNSLNDLNTTNANNLTAQNGALATNVDSPFGNYLGGTLDYGIITKAVFSTNTTLTVQVPEGCTIPTSGGVSAVAYSTQSVPYGFPRDEGRWNIEQITTYSEAPATVTTGSSTLMEIAGLRTSLPIGSWTGVATVLADLRRTAGTGISRVTGISTSTSDFTIPNSVTYDFAQASAQPFGVGVGSTNPASILTTSNTTHYVVFDTQSGNSLIAISGSVNDSNNKIFSSVTYGCNYL